MAKNGSIERFFHKKPKNSIERSLNNLGLAANEINNKRGREESELREDDILGDPALRKPINEYSINIREEVRIRYIAKGPCQPRGQDFPRTDISGCMRKFQETWYKHFSWLEYSVSKDDAFCLWCFLFPTGNKNGDDIFAEHGFKNWKKALEKFRDHEGTNDSRHNYARVQLESFKNRMNNLDYMMARQTKQNEINYRTRLTTVVDVIRFLLNQGLAFRGNDESIDSTNRGNFLELVKWYSEHNEEVNRVMTMNVQGNHQLTSPKVQKDIVNACATEVRNIIVNELREKFFSLLIDEARDSSIKEQMSVVLRYVNDHGEVIERFLAVVHVSVTSALSLKKAIEDLFAKLG